MKQIGLAVANYHDAYGVYPPAYVTDADGNPMHSWRVLILPYLDHSELYSRYNFEEPWDSAANQALLNERPRVYVLHDGEFESDSITSYLAVVGDDTIWPHARSRREEEITDGRSMTIQVVENVGAKIHWTEPRDLEFENMNMDVWSESPNGISSHYQPPAALSADGSVRTFSKPLSAAALRALLTAAGNEDADFNGFREISDGRNRPLKKNSGS